MTISGGFRPFCIEDKHGNTLWEQYSQGPESMSPYFIIPGKESTDLMEKICQKMDSEAEKTETFTIEIEFKKIKFTIVFHLSLDGTKFNHDPPSVSILLELRLLEQRLSLTN